MPHARPEDLPSGGDRWPAIGHGGFRSVQWGDMEVGLTTVHEALDCTEVCKIGGLPGGVCPCPHYGYIFSGQMRARYPGTDWPEEVVTAGETFFIPAGHILIYDEPSKVLELNPAYALQVCMDAMQKAGERAAAAAKDQTAQTAPEAVP